jgi:hypothetical protein
MEKKRVVIPSKYLEQYYQHLTATPDERAYKSLIKEWKGEVLFLDGRTYQTKDLLNALAGQI